MPVNSDLISPCGLYCGVCAIYIAHRDNNEKLKGRLLNLYKGNVPGKGVLPNCEKLTLADIRCSGCSSNDRFVHCRQCEIRSCVKQKGYLGCHQCGEFPCRHVEEFPMTVGKKVILRAIPHLRAAGLQKWVEDEESRYKCPECGNKLFRGAAKCNRCKAQLDLD